MCLVCNVVVDDFECCSDAEEAIEEVRNEYCISLVHGEARIFMWLTRVMSRLKGRLFIQCLIYDASFVAGAVFGRRVHASSMERQLHNFGHQSYCSTSQLEFVVDVEEERSRDGDRGGADGMVEGIIGLKWIGLDGLDRS